MGDILLEMDRFATIAQDAAAQPDTAARDGHGETLSLDVDKMPAYRGPGVKPTKRRRRSPVTTGTSGSESVVSPVRSITSGGDAARADTAFLSVVHVSKNEGSKKLTTHSLVRKSS